MFWGCFYHGLLGTYCPPATGLPLSGRVATCFPSADCGFTSTFLPGSAYTAPHFSRYHGARLEICLSRLGYMVAGGERI